MRLGGDAPCVQQSSQSLLSRASSSSRPPPPSTPSDISCSDLALTPPPPPRTRVHFLFILNVDQYGEDPSVHHTVSAACSVPLPDADNVEVLMRRNGGFDFCAWKEALDTPGRLHGFDFFVLINSSVRGPFFPRPEQVREWPWHFTRQLSDSVKLVGTTINCQSDNDMVRAASRFVPFLPRRPTRARHGRMLCTCRRVLLSWTEPDSTLFGPTLVSTRSLRSLSSWYNLIRSQDVIL